MQFNARGLIPTAIFCLLFLLALRHAMIADTILDTLLWLFLVGGSALAVAMMIWHRNAGPYDQGALFSQVRRWLTGKKRR